MPDDFLFLVKKRAKERLNIIMPILITQIITPHFING